MKLVIHVIIIWSDKPSIKSYTRISLTKVSEALNLRIVAKYGERYAPNYITSPEWVTAGSVSKKLIYMQ